MKVLKFKINRKTLNQMYLSYMRPLLEYAAAVWDSCTEFKKINTQGFISIPFKVDFTHSISLTYILFSNIVLKKHEGRSMIK